VINTITAMLAVTAKEWNLPGHAPGFSWEDK